MDFFNEKFLCMSMFITQIFYPLGYLLNEFLIYIISCFL